MVLVINDVGDLDRVGGLSERTLRLHRGSRLFWISIDSDTYQQFPQLALSKCWQLLAQIITRKPFSRSVVLPFVEKRYCTDRCNPARAHLLPTQVLESCRLLGSSLQVQISPSLCFTCSCGKLGLDRERFTSAMVLIPAHTASGTSRTISTFAENPMTPATAGRLLFPR